MKQRGFSLVELAIVLVIIGLIVGGILTGQDLIRASELNSIMADVNKYKTAVSTFRTKYNGLPGDIRNATSYWGTASGGCPNGAGSGTQTCNGDGNGRIANGNSESYRAWQQLSNAGLVPGNYTGVYSTLYYFNWGTNAPAAKIPNAGFVLSDMGNFSSTYWFASNYNHIIEIGGGATSQYSTTVLTPAEAAAIDGKNDDGLPAFGTIMTLTSNYWACASTAVASTAVYVVSTTTPTCNLLFKTGF